MAGDGWGAPRIHGELVELGIGVFEASVSRYMPMRPVEPDQLNRWLAFLRNHADGVPQSLGPLAVARRPSVNRAPWRLNGRTALR